MKTGGLWLFCVAGAWFLHAGAEAATPSITGFSPSLGEPGLRVVVQGNNLQSVTRLHFHQTPADFQVESPTRIVAVVPLAAESGPLYLNGTVASAQSFVVAPRIEGFFPGRSAPGAKIRIDGANFGGASQVRFGSQSASFSITAPGQIETTVPAGSSNGLIRVVTPAGEAASPLPFEVTGPGPVIDSIEPLHGAPGARVILSGINFRQVSAVRFNGKSATISVTAETQIAVDVPADATSGPVTVTTASGTAAHATPFTVTRAPVITGFSPEIGNPGTQVVVEGINFTNVTGVSFNSVTAAGYGTPAPNQVSAIVPSGAGTGPIRITNNVGVGASSASFRVTTAPHLTQFEPAYGRPGDNVVLTGINFNNVTSVRFGGVNAGFSRTADTQIHATVPNNATSGPIALVSVNATNFSAAAFTVIGNAPYLVEMDPGAGPRGLEVVLRGANFQNITAVRFNGVNAAAVQVVSPTQIRATVPETATTGPVTVVGSAGTGASPRYFYLPPRLASWTPASAFAGTTVTLQGQSFLDAGRVEFAGTAAAFQVTASNRIDAVVPVEAATGRIRVLAPGGAALTEGDFRVLPRILSFTPEIGPVGTVVTLHGTGFHQVSAVLFNGVASAFTPVHSQELRATVPAGASTGPIAVQTPGGTGVSPDAFIVSGPSDLSVTQVLAPSHIAPGGTARIVLTVENHGPRHVTGVTLTHLLPAGLQWLATTVSRGSASRNGNTITASLGVLAPEEQAHVEITVGAPAEGVYLNRATVSLTESDTQPGNNAAERELVVVSEASRTLQVEPAEPGRVVISWPVSPVGFQLESATELPASSWSAVTNTPGVVQQRYRVTNSVSGLRFYRLRR